MYERDGIEQKKKVAKHQLIEKKRTWENWENIKLNGVNVKN